MCRERYIERVEKARRCKAMQGKARGGADGNVGAIKTDAKYIKDRFITETEKEATTCSRKKKRGERGRQRE